MLFAKLKVVQVLCQDHRDNGGDDCGVMTGPHLQMQVCASGYFSDARGYTDYFHTALLAFAQRVVRAERGDAARYGKEAGDLVQALVDRGVVPVVAGGTGLYIKALIYGLFDSRPPEPNIRLNLEHIAAVKGVDFLHQQLTVCDPQAAADIHSNDRFRIIRALETYQATGRPISAHQQEHRFARPRFTAFRIGLTMPRADLYARIDQRVDQMVAEGLLEEVRGLLPRGYNADLKSMQSIGYRHMVDHLQNGVNWPETLRLLKRDTRRYAKRQLTWFRADPDIEWIAPENLGALQPALKSFLATGQPVLKTQKEPNGNI